MYKFLIFIVPFILFCCSQEKKENPNELQFHYLINNYNGDRISSDTISVDKLKQHNDNDILLDQFNFERNKQRHSICLFSNEHYAPVDGSELIFELDTLGVIYSCSTNWFGNMRLKSNNDSLNELIDIALEYCLLFTTNRMNELNLKSKVKEKTVEFSEPIK